MGKKFKKATPDHGFDADDFVQAIVTKKDGVWKMVITAITEDGKHSEPLELNPADALNPGQLNTFDASFGMCIDHVMTNSKDFEEVEVP